MHHLKTLFQLLLISLTMRYSFKYRPSLREFFRMILVDSFRRKRTNPGSIAIVFGSLFIIIGCSSSQDLAANKEKDEDTYKKALENTVAYQGLFTIHQDTLTGATKLAIREDQLDKEYIYFGTSQDGVLEASHFRGMYKDNKIFKIRRYFDKIEFVVQNTGYYFNEESPLSKAADANISEAVLFSEKIEAEDKNNGLLLVDGNSLFLTENFSQIKPSPDPKATPGTFSLGKLNEDKTKYSQIRSYPKNTDVIVEYTYDSPFSEGSTSGAVTDPRFVTIRFQHSFIEMPENDYKPRFDDPRIGYFMTEQNDQVSTSATPYRDLIHRWNLVKKDPTAALSEPVEPIVWWIENTTPHNLRPTIKEAALAWNEAFEVAGFKNAIQVKEQPDDADWDAADIRYNVLRWTSSPNPPFGGYGPSFVNPRTGEILGADIMLEWVFFSNQFRTRDIFTSASSSPSMTAENMNFASCSFGLHMHQNNLFGKQVLQLTDAADDELDDFQKEGLSMLILHELGHTFGLNHNMQASGLHSPTAIHDKELGSTIGLTGSVMDYSTVNVNPDRENQGLYFDVKPGPYDLWAIEYGYSPAVEDPENEMERLNEITARSNEPALAFGNDADDMRSPGKAIDPRVMIGDMSSDPVAYGVTRIELTESLIDKLFEKYSSRDGKSFQELRNAYMTLMGHRSSQAGVIARQIGGVYRERGAKDSDGTKKPFSPVPAEKQKEAMAHLLKYLFAPDAFNSSHEVYSYLQTQRRGFNFFSSTEDPKIHDQVLRMQSASLAHLLHPVTMKRITDSRTYGNTYPVSEVVGDLTAAIFEADAQGDVNTFRQNLQVEYVQQLIKIMQGESHDHLSRSAAIYNLQNIDKRMAKRNNSNRETEAHRAHVALLINKAFESK